MIGDMWNRNNRRDVCTREGQRLYRGRKYSMERGTGYLVCTSLDEYGVRRRLHDVIWENENSEGIRVIPEGYVVHHIDGDKTHNEISNLTLVSVYGHNLIHNPPSRAGRAGRAGRGETREVVIVPGGISKIK